jgi:hypothetical protein
LWQTALDESRAALAFSPGDGPAGPGRENTRQKKNIE